MTISRKNNNLSKNFGSYEDEKSILEKQNIKEDYGDLINKSSDTRSYARDNLSKRTF